MSSIGIVPCAGCTEDSDCAACSCSSCGQRGTTCPGTDRCQKISSKAKPLNVLIGCERSQEICKAFRELGHKAFSCDLEPCTGGHPEWHFIGDVRDYLLPRLHWQVFVVHPPCEDLAASGARYFAEKQKDGSQAQAVKFFMEMVNAPIPMICVENSVGIMPFVPQARPVHPAVPVRYDASKNTCLWLKGLPPLKIDPADYIKPRIVNGRPRWANQTDSGQNKLSPSDHRADDRARTYSGIAKQMSIQWGGKVCQDR